MNEENKNLNLSGEENEAPVKEENTAPENGEENSLNEELETLRETFQEKYDETVEESNSEPVIQELEEGEEEEEPEEEEESENTPVQVKAPRKKKKVGKIIAITIPVLLLILVIGSLLAYVVASITNPNFSTFISTYAQATATEDYDDKISYLEQALEYCSDEESVFQQAMAATIMEEIVVAIYNEEGFASAYSYMSSEMDEAQIKNPVSAPFKKIVKIIDSVNNLSLNAFGKVYENLGDATEVPAYDVLAKGLTVPDDVKTTVESILSAAAEAYIFNRSADGIEDSLLAMNYYANAYSGFVSIGADERALAEKLVVELYNKGYIVEAAAFNTVAINPELEDVNSDYTKVKEELAVFEEMNISVIAVAEEAVSSEKTSEEDILALVKTKAEMTDEQADIIAAMTVYAIDGINAENEKNLAKASTCYATLTSVLEAFGMDDIAAHVKTAKVIFDSGNLSDSSTLVATYLTEEIMADATEEQQAEVDRINAVVDALNATSEVFSPYYSMYYQYGTEIDLDALKTDFEALVTDESDDYTKGFMNYCLYIAAVSSGNTDDAKTYLDNMSSLMPDLPFIYGYSYIADYIENENFTAAYNYANKLLEVNIADEYANSVLSLYARVQGDLDAAEEAALKGIELAGSSLDCTQQLVIVNMLKGDLETAFGYLSTLYSESQSMESFELVLIFDALYEGDNSDITTSLSEMVSIVDQTYLYYGVTSYAETTAIIDGTKTLEDVFMSGDYTITAE